jgi:hypothetical protein
MNSRNPPAIGICNTCSNARGAREAAPSVPKNAGRRGLNKSKIPGFVSIGQHALMKDARDENTGEPLAIKHNVLAMLQAA